MNNVILGTSMSVDGFIHDCRGSAGRLNADMAPGNVEDASFQNREDALNVIRLD